jgi:hypothetical protein
MFFFLSFLFSAKSENRKAKQVLLMRKDWHQWKGRGDRERGRRVNRVQKVFTHACK